MTRLSDFLWPLSSVEAYKAGIHSLYRKLAVEFGIKIPAMKLSEKIREVREIRKRSRS